MRKVHSTENINLLVGDGLKTSYGRKVCEYIFAKEKIKIKLLLQGVKKLKQKVGIEELGVKIKKIRKTGRGDLALTVGGEQDKANALISEIRNKIDNVKVSTKANGAMIVFVMGIDPATKEKELIEAMAKETKLEQRDINVRAITKGKYEEQTTTIELPRKKATDLIRQRKVKVGCVECRVRERIYIGRCFT
ncbi:hypothetical protein QE152_g7276 [Popillia japonica]|uniref:Uncharacterized protein n=1 Tax=Popillia japonica TaxID=7064 RepID=A0AAW1MF66_POPJA